MYAPSLATMVENIGLVLPQLTLFVTALAYVLGGWFVIKGVISFKNIPPIGNSNPQVHLFDCIMYLIIGAILIYLPSAISVGTSTFFSETNPYIYIDDPSSDPFQQFIKIVFDIVRFIGLVSFIRGAVQLSYTASQHEHHPKLKASTHMLGGIFCINLAALLQMLFITLGIGSF